MAEQSDSRVSKRDKVFYPARCRSNGKLTTKRHVLVLAAYLVLALVLTFPLVLQFADHVPGTTTWSMDEYGYVWNNWWFKHAVFDLGTNPFQTNHIFYPVGTGLVLYTYTLLHVLIGLPIQFLFGLVPASNAEFLFAFVLSAYGAFLASRYLIRTLGTNDRDANLAAFVAGCIFAFASNRFVYSALGHYNVVATEWIPFYVLFLVKTVRERRWSNALLAGLFAALAMYVETTDGVLLLLFTLLYLAVSWSKITNRASLARLGAVVATVAVLFSPLMIPTVMEIAHSGYSLPGWGHAEKLLVDLFGFWTPTSLQILNRHWVQELDQVRQTTSRFIDVNTVFLGYATVALAYLAAIRYWRAVSVWVYSAVVFAVLCLGPLLHIRGQSTFDFDGLQITFPMPFLLLHYIPVLRENRVPNRFSVLVMLSLAILAGFAVAWLLGKLHDRLARGGMTGHRPRLAAFAVVLVAVLGEHASMPLPLTDARVPDVYSEIAREPGEFSVLTLPLGWRNSFGQLGAEDTRIQYYQSVHEKYIFPGNIQRNPALLFDYFDRISLFHSLTELEFYNAVPEETVERDRNTAAALMAFFDVRYVVIQPSIPGRPPYSDTRAAVVDYVQQVLPLGDKIYDRDGVLAYRINQAPLPARLKLDFGTEDANLYRAEGWDRDEKVAGLQANWVNRQEARVFFPVREIADYELTVRAMPYVYPQAPGQSMQIVVNGRTVQQVLLKQDWQSYTATIPAGALRSGLNDIVFRFGYAVRPQDVVPARFGIAATEVNSPVDIVVNSAVYGSIQVNGREVSLLGRGYNVVVVDPLTGEVISARVFNTADDRSQSRNMTDFLAAVPNGLIVIVAAQEDVSASLGDKTVAELRSLGAQIDMRQGSDHAHAIIGVKGAPSGSALEKSGADSAFISVGRDPDSRTLAAAVSAITIERK